MKIYKPKFFMINSTQQFQSYQFKERLTQVQIQVRPHYNNKMQKAQNFSPTYMPMPHQFVNIKKIVFAQVYTTQFILAFDKENLYVSPIININDNSLTTVNESTAKDQSKSPIRTDKSNNQQNNAFLQIFAIPNIKEIQVIAKNFVLITTQANYIGLFNMTVLKKQPVQQSQTSSIAKTDNQTSTTSATSYQKIEFQVVMQWFLHKSYFIREVIDNVFEVQIFVNDNQLIIYQFTTKNKIGKMYFNMNANGKIKNSEKNQIYGSKSFINLNRKALYTLKNFGDKSFIITPLLINGIVKVGSAKNIAVYNQSTQQNSLIGFFGLKDQEYFSVYSNMSIISCSNPLINHKIIQKDADLNSTNFKFTQKYPKIQIQKNPYSQAVKSSQNSQEVIRYSQFLEYLMIQNNQSGKISVYHIKPKNSRIVNCQFWNNEQSWKWYIGWGKRLIGLNLGKKLIKFIKLGSELKIKDQQIKLYQSTDQPIQIKNKQQSQNKNKQNIQKEEAIRKKSGQSQKAQNQKIVNQSVSQKKATGPQSNKATGPQSNKATGPQSNKATGPQSNKATGPQSNKIQTKSQIKNQQKITKQQQSPSKKGSSNQNIQVKQQKKQQLKSQNTETNQKQEQNLGANKFKPMKIIQRNKTSVSKTLQKSKQIAPLQSQTKIQPKQEANGKNQNIVIDASKTQKYNKKTEQSANKATKSDIIDTQRNKITKIDNQNCKQSKQSSNSLVSKINEQQKEKEKEKKQESNQDKNINNHKVISRNSTQNIKLNQQPVVDRKYVQMQMLSEDSDFTQEQTQQIQSQANQKNTPQNVQKIQNKDDRIAIMDKNQQKKDNRNVNANKQPQENKDKNNEKINTNTQKNVKVNLSWKSLSSDDDQEEQDEQDEQIENKLVTSLLEDESDQDEKEKNKNSNTTLNLNIEKDKNPINKSQTKVNTDQGMKLVFSTTINRNKIFGTQNQTQEKISSQTKKNNVQSKTPVNQEKYSFVTDQNLDKIFKVKSAGESDFLISNIFSNKSTKQKYVQQGAKSQNMKIQSDSSKKNQNPFKFNNFNLFNQNISTTIPDIPKLNMPIPTTNIFAKNNLINNNPNHTNNTFTKSNDQTGLFSKVSNPSNNIFSNFKKGEQKKQTQKVQQKQSPTKQKTFQLAKDSKKQQLKSQNVSTIQINSKLNKKMEQIQTYIQKFQVSLIKCIQDSEKNVLKKVQQLPNTHNPYNKASSLVIPNQIKDELISQLKVQVKKWMMQQMFKKIQVSFKQLMQDHKGVYDQALQYYAGQAKKKIASLQLQFQQQNVMLNQMQLISNNMKASLQNIILQGQQMHIFQLKEFKKQIAMSTQSLEEVSNYINNPNLIKQKQQRSKKYQETLTQLKQLKAMLMQKQKKKEQKRLKKQQQQLILESERAEKQRRRLKKQKKMIQQRISKDLQKQKQKKLTSKNKIERKEQKQKKKLNRTVHI